MLCYLSDNSIVTYCDMIVTQDNDYVFGIIATTPAELELDCDHGVLN